MGRKVGIYHKTLTKTINCNTSNYPNGWQNAEQLIYNITGVNGNPNIVTNTLANQMVDGHRMFDPDYFTFPMDYVSASANKDMMIATAQRYQDSANPYCGIESYYYGGTLYAKGFSWRGSDNMPHDRYFFMPDSRDSIILYEPQTNSPNNVWLQVDHRPTAFVTVRLDFVFPSKRRGYCIVSFNFDNGPLMHNELNYQSKSTYIYVWGLVSTGSSNATWSVYEFDGIPTQFRNEGQGYNYMTSGYGLSQPPYQMAISLSDFYLPNRTNTTYIALKLTSRLPTNMLDENFLEPMDNYITGFFAYLTDYNVVEGDRDDGEPPEVNSNPFDEPTAQESTGAGPRDNSSDIIPVGDNNTLPSNTNSPLNISGGLLTEYVLDSTEMSAFGSALWASSTLQDIENRIYRPLENIHGLFYTNAPMPSDSQVATYLKIAGYDFNNTVTCNKLTGNWVSMDCGNVNITEYFGSCLDYTPYTQISLYLPYVGVVPLDCDYIVDSNLNVRYNIDLLTGNLVVHVSCNKDNHGIVAQGIIGSYEGNCFAQLPVTQSGVWSTQAVLGIGTSISSLFQGFDVGNAIGSIPNALNTAGTKPTYQKSGSLSGNIGMMCYKKPYLIIERPVDYVPQNYYKYVGLNSYVEKKLSDIKGWFKCENPIVNINANREDPSPIEEEIDEIKSLLESGVRIL